MILKDAEKEFDQVSKIGFGLDVNEQERDTDFENVRGRYEQNKFVNSLRKEIDLIISSANKLIETLEGI